MEAGGSSSSASQLLLRLIRNLLPPSASDSLVSSQYATAVQLLSNSSASSKISSSTASTELAIAEKVKRRLIRDGRDSDTVAFQALLQRLQKSNILKHREAILDLFLHLSDSASSSSRPQQRYKKVAPFLIKGNGKLQSTTVAQNGDSYDESSQDQPPSYLSSIHEIRYQMGGGPSGYHPPLPPKPKSPISLFKKSKSTNEVITSSNDPVKPSEKALLRELIYAFQGIEGVMIRRSHKNDCFSIKENQRKHFPAPVIQVSLRLAELGWLYNRVVTFCNDMAEKKEVGLIGQSLVTALRNELSEYYRLLSTIEAHLQDSNGVSLSLLHLAVWTLEPTNRMKLLVSVVDACKGQKGGALISTIYSFLRHGDETSSEAVHTILCTVCQPMYLMLLRWICDGTLEDPYNEFFIASDLKIQGDRLWQEKYSIRSSMIPKFLTLAWVKKILATGKSINFLHEVCHDTSPISGRDFVKASLDETSPENMFSHPYGDNLLHRTIQRAFTDTSAHVLSILFTRYKFLDHISAMRKYLLLGQGDIIRYLLQLLEDELCQPATTLYPHNLAGILETAIRATNAQYEAPDILERLDVRLLDIQPGDVGWDVFSLDYKVAGPIGTVFGPETMNEYLMLFNALWRAKRIEWILSCVWKQQAGLHKMCKTVPELRPLLHIANLLASEMIHFIHQLAYYITFEVMECSWDILIKQLRQAESLDEVIEAHEEFLRTLLKQSLLDERSRDLLTQLRAIYDRIIEFQSIQNKLYTSAIGEVEARAADLATLRRRERQGTYGVTEAEEEGQRERSRTFNKIILQNLKSQLKIVSQSYQDMVRMFLLQLTCSQDQALQFLSFRLDFNQHYKRKDARLGTPLTFQHRRESMITTSFHV